ncbi:MAG TPA: phospholipase D-like domain-containing protein [Longimicrobiaceae bacterium]
MTGEHLQPIASTDVTALSSRTRQIARGVWRLASARMTAGNRVRLLHDGPETFDTMIGAIESAREQVVLESYIVRPDAVGRRFSETLRSVAERGVRVRMLVDGIGSRSTPRRFWDELRVGLVDVRIFNRIGWRPWFGLVPRDHRKLLVVDERIGFTGGFGLGEEWDPARPESGPPRQWRDTAVEIDGPAARDMHRAFERMWERTARRSASAPPLEEHLNRPGPPLTDGGALVAIVEGEPWKLRVARGLQVQSVLAERSIWIATAYFIPSFVEIEGLTGAARDGVDVRLLLPSKNDHPWVTRLARRFYPNLLRSGVRIWEWGGVMMHAKTTVVDGRWVRVGSTDLNPLGFAVNYELDAIIDDPDLGEDAEAMFLADLERSREIVAESV